MFVKLMNLVDVPLFEKVSVAYIKTDEEYIYQKWISEEVVKLTDSLIINFNCTLDNPKVLDLSKVNANFLFAKQIKEDVSETKFKTFKNLEKGEIGQLIGFERNEKYFSHFLENFQEEIEHLNKNFDYDTWLNHFVLCASGLQKCIVDLYDFEIWSEDFNDNFKDIDFLVQLVNKNEIFK